MIESILHMWRAFKGCEASELIHLHNIALTITTHVHIEMNGYVFTAH